MLGLATTAIGIERCVRDFRSVTLLLIVGPGVALTLLLALHCWMSGARSRGYLVAAGLIWLVLGLLNGQMRGGGLAVQSYIW